MGLVNLLKTYKLLLIGIVVGSTAGYLYFHFVGCASGTCAITSKPVNSTLYGAVMGGLLFSIFKKEHNKTQNNDTSN
jgi:hypothetical protein